MTTPLLLVLLGALVLVAGLGALLRTRMRRREARRLYAAQLERALEDGILTPEELEDLGRIRSRGALSDGETRMAALAVYRRALRDAAADARFTDDEQSRIRALRDQLGLSAEDLATDREQLHRLWLLWQVEHGRLPRVEPPFALGEKEVCHWAVRATSCGRSGLPSSRPETRGIRFAVGDDAPFQVLGEREHLEADPRILPMDIGTVVVTDRRVVFRGARRRFVVPHVVLDSIVLFRDGLRLVIDRSAPIHLLVQDPELTAAILLRAAAVRRHGLGDASPAQTA